MHFLVHHLQRYLARYQEHSQAIYLMEILEKLRLEAFIQPYGRSIDYIAERGIKLGKSIKGIK